MMTRGTRGDVQPFVALARGLAERLGWLAALMHVPCDLSRATPP